MSYLTKQAEQEEFYNCKSEVQLNIQPQNPPQLYDINKKHQDGDVTKKIHGGEVRLGVEEYFALISKIKKYQENKAPKNFILSER